MYYYFTSPPASQFVAISLAHRNKDTCFLKNNGFDTSCPTPLSPLCWFSFSSTAMGDFRRNLACTRVSPPSSAELGSVKRTDSLILHCLKAGSCAHKPIRSASLSSPENDQAD